MEGIELIALERKRQIQEEKWENRHDDSHVDGQLANAAASYALHKDWRFIYKRSDENDVPMFWPWDKHWWKPSPEDRIKELTKAGALIAAEIDRLLRKK